MFIAIFCANPVLPTKVALLSMLYPVNPFALFHGDPYPSTDSTFPAPHTQWSSPTCLPNRENQPA